MAGYHILPIRRGDFGELTKIREELDEAMDADCQNNSVMILLELSDMIGAIHGYLQKHHPTVTIDDLIKMADATHRAFATGDRQCKRE